MSAASVHDVAPDDLAYKQIEKRHGFLRMRRRVMIEVDPENLLRSRQDVAAAPAVVPEAAQQAPVPASVVFAPEVTPEAAPPEGEVLERALPESALPESALPESVPAAAEESSEERPAADRGTSEREERSRERGGRERGGRERGGQGRGGRGRGGRGRGGRDPGGERRSSEGGGDPRPARPPVERGPREPFEPTPEMHTAAADAVDRLAQLARLRVAAEVSEGEDRLELDLSGPDQDRLTSEDGEVLLALEQLVPRVMRGLIGVSAPVRLDCDDFRSEAEAALRAQARFAAEEVQRTGRETILDPMAPAERRIIHMTLSDDRNVETESEGEGFFKRVTVRPL